jgi:FkbM family methyltransferase
MINKLRDTVRRFPRIKRFLNTVILYIKYPYHIITGIKILLRLPRAKFLGIKFLQPNFIFKNNINSSSIIVDVGCGFEADFSKTLINKYNLNSFGIDPTKKHQTMLRDYEKQSNGKFKYLNYAISPIQGKITFRESIENESGSILTDHINVLQDTINEYEVDSITLKQIPEKTGIDKIDILKLDIEGVEYELFYQISDDDLSAFSQIFVEFHHRSIQRYSRKNTKEIVNLIRSKGFKVITLDSDNYLFYR